MRARAETRVLFMTGYSDHAVPEPTPGTVGFIQKPFGTLALLSEVRRLLDGARK